MSKVHLKRSFCPITFYVTTDKLTHNPLFAYVLQVHETGLAVLALIFDDTWGFVAFRWCRVKKDVFVAGRFSFHVDNIVKDRACIPPPDVLDFLACRA